MSLISFLAKQFIGVIQWNEPQEGVLAYRYPMRDLEIQNGGQLTVSESQMVAFVNEGQIADIFGPGLHTLSTRNLPILTGLMDWDADFESPFKSEVYYFSTRLQVGRRWGVEEPVTVRDREFGAVPLRCSGSYAFRIFDPHLFFNQVSGQRDVYFTTDLEGQLRTTIVDHLAGVFAKSGLPLLDLAANQALLGAEIVEQLKPIFRALGLELISVSVENIALPEELSTVLNQRAGMGVAQGSDITKRAPVFMHSASATTIAEPETASASPSTGSKLCIQCGERLPGRAKFCSECGHLQ